MNILDLEDLYHVIFDEKYETFQILDNCLQIIWRPCPLLEN